jgi:uncharacterized protein YggE
MRCRFFCSALIVALVQGRVVSAEEHGPPVPSISVVGEGEVHAQPDLASVTMGVTTEAKTAAEALKANSERMSELVKTLKGNQVPEKDILTSSFSVSPQQVFDRDGKAPRIVGYMVTNQVTVKGLGVTRVGAILDAVVQVGGNQIQGVAFSISDPQPHLDAARRKAIEDAQHRAAVYADAAGMRLGKPLLIQEQSASPPRPIYAQAMRGVAAAEVPISAGEQAISAQISVTYAILDK